MEEGIQQDTLGVCAGAVAIGVCLLEQEQRTGPFKGKIMRSVLDIAS